jgi:hypothetical protein
MKDGILVMSKEILDISAKITGVSYKPLLCSDLEDYELNTLGDILKRKTAFILNVDGRNKIAISWWRSAKRTRSYPYARVYNTMSFSGKKVTIIPVFKDEGLDGDRDFLQWDTVSLMSLLGVYVIISYYVEANISRRYKNKITNQRFDIEQIKNEINKLLSYQSDALHWNSEKVEKIGEIAEKALLSYQLISDNTGIQMHSVESANKKVYELLKDKESFMSSSRRLAKQAQNRESVTVQPKEFLSGNKAILTIKNYLGGYYYLTVDEAEVKDNVINLIEAKHTSKGKIPSTDDIKDGLMKMHLFANLKEVRIGNNEYQPNPILKLSVAGGFSPNNLNTKQTNICRLLEEEANTNGFKIIYV